MISICLRQPESISPLQAKLLGTLIYDYFNKNPGSVELPKGKHEATVDGQAYVLDVDLCLLKTPRNKEQHKSPNDSEPFVYQAYDTEVILGEGCEGTVYLAPAVVKLKRDDKKQIIADIKPTERVIKITDLNPTKEEKIKITAQNTFAVYPHGSKLNTVLCGQKCYQIMQKLNGVILGEYVEKHKDEIKKEDLLFILISWAKELKNIHEKTGGFGDPHRGNFMINEYTKEVHAVDLGGEQRVELQQDQLYRFVNQLRVLVRQTGERFIKLRDEIDLLANTLSKKEFNPESFTSSFCSDLNIDNIIARLEAMATILANEERGDKPKETPSGSTRDICNSLGAQGNSVLKLMDDESLASSSTSCILAQEPLKGNHEAVDEQTKQTPAIAVR